MTNESNKNLDDAIKYLQEIERGTGIDLQKYAHKKSWFDKKFSNKLKGVKNPDELSEFLSKGVGSYSNSELTVFVDGPVPGSRLLDGLDYREEISRHIMVATLLPTLFHIDSFSASEMVHREEFSSVVPKLVDFKKSAEAIERMISAKILFLGNVSCNSVFAVSNRGGNQEHSNKTTQWISSVFERVFSTRMLQGKITIVSLLDPYETIMEEGSWLGPTLLEKVKICHSYPNRVDNAIYSEIKGFRISLSTKIEGSAFDCESVKKRVIKAANKARLGIEDKEIDSAFMNFHQKCVDLKVPDTIYEKVEAWFGYAVENDKDGMKKLISQMKEDPSFITIFAR